MEKSTLYYDGKSVRSTAAAQMLKERHREMELVEISSKRESIIYEKNSTIGFFFASPHGHLPAEVVYLVKHLVMDKQAYIYAYVVGGNHEFRAIREMDELLSTKGYTLASAYAECMLKKISPKEEMQLEKIENDIHNRRWILHEFRDHMESVGKAVHEDVKRRMKKDLKSYLRIKGTKSL